MTQTSVKPKFYTFNQNNSGGYFVKDDKYGVCENVIVEAISPTDAWDRLQKIGDNVSGFMDYCGCCGERWSDYVTESDGKDEPLIYGVPVENVKIGPFTKKAFVHYMDGTIVEFTHS